MQSRLSLGRPRRGYGPSIVDVSWISPFSTEQELIGSHLSGCALMDDEAHWFDANMIVNDINELEVYFYTTVVIRGLESVGRSAQAYYSIVNHYLMQLMLFPWTPSGVIKLKKN